MTFTPPFEPHYMQTGPLDTLPAFRTRFDEYPSQHSPNHHWWSTSPENLKEYLKMMGAKEDNLQEYLQQYNERWDQLTGGEMNVLGNRVKPFPQGDELQLFIHIPNSQYAIGIWSGGLQQLRHYCFDFYNVTSRVPVNTPEGFELWGVRRPGTYSYGGQIKSWEAAFGLSDILPGEEKYSAPEGSRIVLRRPREDPFYFQVPEMPAENGAPFAHAVDHLR